jgi:3-hydroxyisobutyrate dehydrogenase-like beta-hydroxyacid dehydrogenase
MKPRVGIIGLGVIGRPIAERVAAAGLPLAVYDVRPEPVAALVSVGATAYGCAAEVADAADLVIRSGEYASRWKTMLEASVPGELPPNLRKDLHAALSLARQLGVRLHLGAQASLIADAGIATGHDDPAL